MTLPTKEDLLKEIKKQEKIFSIQLKFDDLVKKGVVERKKGTKWTYAILKPYEFPMEAINQSSIFTQVTTKTKDKEITKMYFQFPKEKQRLKTLNKYKTMRERLS